MARNRINQKTLWNVAVVAVLLMIMLAIGVFIGRTLTMNTPGNAVPTASPSDAPDNSYNVITVPSTPPGTSPAPAMAASATPTPTPMASPVTPTPTAVPTPYPTLEPTPYPTQSPQTTPTPTPVPGDLVADAPFYESITPIKPGDSLPSVSDQDSYDPGNGPIFIDLANSYMGSPYAYPGDTVGIKLKLYDMGPAIDAFANVDMTLKKMVITSTGQVVWIDYPIDRQFTTKISMGDHGSMYKNISYTIPSDMPDLKGTYKIYIKFYLNDQYSAGVTKVLSIL